MDPRDREAIERFSYTSDSANPGDTPTVYQELAISRNLTPGVDKQLVQLAERIEECKKCPELNQFKFCRQCGCHMPLKVRIKSARCPIGKWHPIVPVKFLEPDDN